MSYIMNHKILLLLIIFFGHFSISYCLHFNVKSPILPPNSKIPGGLEENNRIITAPYYIIDITATVIILAIVVASCFCCSCCPGYVYLKEKQERVRSLQNNGNCSNITPNGITTVSGLPTYSYPMAGNTNQTTYGGYAESAPPSYEFCQGQSQGQGQHSSNGPVTYHNMKQHGSYPRQKKQ